MRYLKTFESFSGDNKETVDLAAEILAMAGENVTPQDVEKSVEDSIEEAPQAQAQGQAQGQGQAQNESVSEFLTWWWDIMTQQQYNPGTLDYGMTLAAYGAWLATLASTGLAATGIYKMGKAIKGLFKNKEVDFTEFVKNWSEKNNVDLSKVDLNTEEGKKIMAKMYKDFKDAGGKI